MLYVQNLFLNFQFWLSRRSQFFLRLTIIVAVLASSAFFAYSAVNARTMKEILYNPVLILSVGIVVSVILLTHPEWGLVILPPTLVMLTIDIGTGTGTSIGIPVIMLVLLIGLWFFDMIARQRVIRLYPTLAFAPMVAFLAASLIALGFGQLPWFDFFNKAPIRAQLGEIAIFFLSFGMFLWVGHAITDLNMLRIALFLFIFTGFIVMAGEYSSLLARATNGLVHHAIRGNSMYWTWLAALSFGQIVLNRKLALHWRLAMIVVLASACFVGFVRNRGWTSGWLPPLIAMFVIVWFGFPKLRKWTVLGGILVAIFVWQKVYGVVMVGDNEYSLNTRLAAWQIIAQIVPVSPLFGLGPANYYWYTPLFPIMGWRVVFNSHNNYVDLIAQLGIVGTACFFWFAWRIVRISLKLRSVIQEDFSRAYVHSILGGWIATLAAGMLGDWFLPFVYNIGYAGLRASLLCWFFLGGLLYLERVYFQREESGQNDLALYAQTTDGETV